MTTLTPLRQIELVVVARNQEATLDQSVRRLRDHLLRRGADLFPSGWRITIADHASTDATGTIAERLAAELDDVGFVHLSQQVDRKALRSNWAQSQATIAAFVTLDPEVDLDALLRPLVTHSGGSEAVTASGLTRRGALFAAGGIGLTALLAACGRNGSSSSAATTGASGAATSGTSAASTSAATGAATSAAAATVALAPEMTEGPYYLDLDLVRADIREDREGAVLALTLSVIDVNTGAPVSGAAVDIWHCDANGFYSGFVSQSAAANGGTDVTDDGTFLRGTQLSDASGNVTFTTIYPGWYQGRTVHIHVKVHVNGSEIHTGQLFFDDSFTDEVFASTEPYASRGERQLRNDQDNIFQGGGDESTLTVTKDGDSYTTTLAVGVSA
jgi:protocatechuate 3,4-dioxygenase beta subunit